VPQLGDHDNIFPTGQYPVHGGKLPGQADGLPHMIGLCRNVEAIDRSAILFKQRGKDFHNGCLARAV
jgi:hypothetical protein